MIHFLLMKIIMQVEYLATKLLKPEQVIIFNHNDFNDLEEK